MNKEVVVAFSLDDIKSNINTSKAILITNVLLCNLGAQVILQIVNDNKKTTFAIDCGNSIAFLLFLLKGSVKYFLFSNDVQYKNVINDINSTLLSNIKIFTDHKNLLEFLSGL